MRLPGQTAGPAGQVVGTRRGSPSQACLPFLFWGLLLAGTACEKVEARSLIREGNALYRAGRYEEAIKRYRAASGLDPDLPILHLHLGYANMALCSSREPPGSLRFAREAAAAFLRYMQLRPADERGPRFYLQVLLDAGKLKEALGFLRTQHQKNPRDVKVLASLGEVSSRAGLFSEALGWYQKQAAMLPGDAKARYFIGTLCWRRLYKNEAVTGQKRIRVADHGIAALAEALRIQPGYTEALTYINLLYRERAKGQVAASAREKDMEQARHYYRQALEQLRRDGVRKQSVGEP